MKICWYNNLQQTLTRLIKEGKYTLFTENGEPLNVAYNADAFNWSLTRFKRNSPELQFADSRKERETVCHSFGHGRAQLSLDPFFNKLKDSYRIESFFSNRRKIHLFQISF